MTKEYFYDNWYKECLKGGVLTIPDNLTEFLVGNFMGVRTSVRLFCHLMVSI